MDIEKTLELLDDNHRRAIISKTQHFYAAERFRNLSHMFNVPVILINVALGSVFFYAINNEIPEVAKWISASFALIAALLSGVRQFYDFESKVETHRGIANQYLSVRDICERYIAISTDNNTDLVECVENVQKRMKDIRKNEASFPTNHIDYTRALKDIENKKIEKRLKFRIRKKDPKLQTQAI